MANLRDCDFTLPKPFLATDCTDLHGFLFASQINIATEALNTRKRKNMYSF
jgi:hypothetical protein